MTRAGLLFALSALAACAPPVDVDAGPADAGTDAGTADAGPDNSPTHHFVLDNAAMLAELRAPIGGEVKYLAVVDGRTPRVPLDDASCVFQNMARFPFHLNFLRSFPENDDLSFDAYVSAVLERDTRIFYGGGIEPFPGVTHPLTGNAGLVVYTVYSTTEAPLNEAELREIDARLKTCAPFAASLLTYLPTDPGQQAAVTPLVDDLAEDGIAVIFPNQLTDGVSHITYARGEAYGTLVVVDGEVDPDDVGPRDILLTRHPPPDLTLPGGLLTDEPQTLFSHLNLRLLEKGIPNASVPGAVTSPLYAGLVERLVHLVVSDDDVVLELATLADAEAFWEANRPTPPVLQLDSTVTEIRSLSAIDREDGAAFGAKAATLGALTAVLEAPHRPDGVAIPFAHFLAHAERAGALAAQEALVSDPRAQTDRAFLRARLREIRRGVRDTAVSPALIDEVRSALGPLAEGKLRFRSSTNVEDLPELTGAGLYDSASGCFADDDDGDTTGPSRCLTEPARAALQTELDARLAEYLEHPDRHWLPGILADLQEDLTEERTVARALGKVFASLFNDRAFTEREFYGIEHRDAAMAVAVHPAFVGELANAVVVAGLNAGERFHIVVQPGELSVVRPADPLAIPEQITFRRAGDEAVDITELVDGPPGRVLDDESVRILAPLLFAVVDALGEPLDMEVKQMAEDGFVIKQARPFVAPSGLP